MHPDERVPHDRDTFDRRLRAMLEPEPGVAARIVDRARTAAPVRPRRRRLALAAIVAATLTIAALAISMVAVRRSPEPAPLPASHSAALRISNEAGAVVVTSTDGSQWMILSRTGDPP